MQTKNIRICPIIALHSGQHDALTINSNYLRPNALRNHVDSEISDFSFANLHALTKVFF